MPSAPGVLGDNYEWQLRITTSLSNRDDPRGRRTRIGYTSIVDWPFVLWEGRETQCLQPPAVSGEWQVSERPHSMMCRIVFVSNDGDARATTAKAVNLSQF